MHLLVEADKDFFNLINNKWNNGFFDVLMPLVRNANFWLPLYLFLLVFALLNIRKSGWFILFILVTVGLTDTLSSHIIKNLVFRLRPCHNPELAGTIRILASYCPQSSSFTSSHATNHFGLAVFASRTLHRYAGRWIYLTYLWAFMISYAQVYVGVHYPIDVICGSLIGVMAGLLTSSIYLKKWGNLNFDNQVS
ncbi:MAG: phosphatase PAP2 family protein [Flavisolibacter sp.]